MHTLSLPTHSEEQDGKKMFNWWIKDLIIGLGLEQFYLFAVHVAVCVTV